MNFFIIYGILCFKSIIYFAWYVNLPSCPSCLNPHPNLLSSILHVIQLLGEHGKVDVGTLVIQLCDLALLSHSLFLLFVVAPADGRVLTVVSHRNEGTTPVDGFQEPGSFVQNVMYDADMDQIEALINRSTSCQQRLRYECKQSHLFNSPCMWSVLYWNAFWICHSFKDWLISVTPVIRILTQIENNLNLRHLWR